MRLPALDRKLLRDLALMWSQALSIALVVASGVMGFIAIFSAFDALQLSRERYYTEARFADVFASVRRAPDALRSQIAALPGVALIDTRISRVVQVDLPGVSDPILGQLIGLNADTPQTLNVVQLRSGRLPRAHHAGALEVAVSEAFANTRGLKAGDRLRALINGRRESLVVVGIALSPEFVFAGSMGSPDPRGFGVFWIDQGVLASAYAMNGAFNQLAVRLAPQANEVAVIAGLNQLLGPYGGANAHGRSQQMSDTMLRSEIQEQKVMATVLPSIFLAVAAFLLHVVLSRLIATQREQIAALKALGYRNLAIGAHYLKLMLCIVLLGLLIGVVGGAWLGRAFITLYDEVFRFPVFYHRMRADMLLVAVLATAGVACLATWHAIRAAVWMPPAQAMRPPSPDAYQPSVIERWGLRRFFSTGTRMVLRNLQRRPWRALLAVLGMSASMAVLIAGTFWRDTIDLLLTTQFQQILRGDVTIGLVEARSVQVTQELARLPHVSAVEGARSVSVRIRHAQHDWSGSIQGRNPQAALYRIVDARQQMVAPPPDGLLLTDRLAERLGVRPGDSVRVEVQEGQRPVLELPVTGVVAEMMGLNAYIERRSLNHLLGEGDLINQATLSVDRGHEQGLLMLLKEMPAVAGAFSKAVLLANIQGLTARNLLVISGVLTLFATVIAVGVVYNQARIALAERAWELASLRVLGFTRREVSGLLLGELALEIALAIPLGLLAGRALAGLLVSLVKNDEYYFPLVISPATYAYATLCMALAGAASAWVVSRRIQGLDLVGVLKTRE